MRINTSIVEEMYGVKYVGYYDIPGIGPNGNIAGPFYVFYQENPKTELGHSHYMGLGIGLDGAFVFNAKNIADATFNAIHINDKFICSRYRHDYQECGSAMIDGGLDYCRYNPNHPITHSMKIVGGKEVFTPIERETNEKS